MTGAVAGRATGPQLARKDEHYARELSVIGNAHEPGPVAGPGGMARRCRGVGVTAVVPMGGNRLLAAIVTARV